MIFRSSAYWFAALVLGGLAAFWPKYLSRPFDQIDTATHIHAAAMAMWCILLIAQPMLIRRQLRQWHRSLGILSYGLVPLMMVSSILVAHLRFRMMDEATFQAEADFLYLPLSAVVLFVVSYGGAVVFRRTTAIHARLMVCTGLVLIDPVLGRLLAFYAQPFPGPDVIQAITYGLTDLILLALILRERNEARGRMVFPTMLAFFVPIHAMWFLGAHGEQWQTFAAWFRSLPLT